MRVATDPNPELSAEVPVFDSGTAYVGTHVKPSDGQGDCDDGTWVADALSLIGITTHSDFMETFYKRDKDGVWNLKDTFKSGTNGLIDKNAVKQAFLELAQQKGDPVVTCLAKRGCSVDQLSDAARYVLYFENFLNGCGAKEVTGADAKNSIDNDHKATVTYIDSKGSDSKKTYKLEASLGDTVVVGAGVVADAQLQCKTIVDRINDYAPAYKLAVQDAISKNQPVGGLGSTSGSGDGSESCEERTALSTGWIVCGFLQLVSNGLDTIMNMVDSMLNIDAQKLYTNSDLKASWSYFRAIATFALFAIGLVIVIAQALGGGQFLDAYTVKKALPRLVIAVILIQLSWPLFTLLIYVVGQIAWGLEGLLYAPFGGRAALDIGHSLEIVGGNLEFTTLFVSGSIGGIALFSSLGVPGVISLAITALLGLLIAFFVLAIRQVLVVLLLVTAPIALAAWILPNTEKLWKIWWESFSKVLLMYPLIILLIAGGRVAAHVAASSGINGPVGVVVVILAFFGPFFLIPKTAQVAGSAFANIAGIANNRSKGAFDRLKNYRGNKASENWAKTKAGTRFNNNSLNALTSRATSRNLGFGHRGRAAYNQKLDLAAAEHAKSAQGQAVQHNDGALRALTYDSESAARAGLRRGDFGNMTEENIDRAIGAARASGGFGRARQVWAAQQLSATGTGYDNLGQVTQTIARVSHGNQDQISSLAGNINSTTKSVGRHDLAPGYGALDDLSRQAAGLASSNATDGAPTTMAQGELAAWNSGSLYQHANDKPRNLRNHIATAERLLNSGDADDRAAGTRMLAEFRAMQPNAVGENANHINDALARLDVGMQNPDGTPMMRQVRRVDPANPNNYIYEDQQIRLSDTAQGARTYQRLNENEIGET